MTEITSHSATELVEQIHARRLSPVEVVAAYLRRIDDLNPALNAIVTLASDLTKQAEAAEAALMRGDEIGPLHGLPITIKDTISTAGLRTTSGSLRRADFVPEEDAPAVMRLKAAGAIILGKTNTAEMAMDYTADNPVFGRTNNPYDSTLTPGGSSGGEAAAIAAAMSPCGIGTDLAGSIRIPAHFCGIAGLRPTIGRVPGEGQFPAARGPYSLGGVIGPLARQVSDLELLFRVLAGIEPGATFSSGPDELRQAMNGRSVAWYANDGVAPVTDETSHAVEAAGRALAAAGLNVVHEQPPGIERGHELWLKMFSRASVVELRDVYAGHEDEGGDFVKWRLATADDAPLPTLDDYIRDWLERDRVREELLAWMEASPLLLAPVGAVPAFPHDAHKVTVGEQSISTFRAFSYSQSFNVFDLPVVCVPVATSREGLPIGVQIAGLPSQEHVILGAAQILEDTFGVARAGSPL